MTKRLIRRVLTGAVIAVALVVTVTAALSGYDSYCTGKTNAICR